MHPLAFAQELVGIHVSGACNNVKERVKQGVQTNLQDLRPLLTVTSKPVQCLMNWLFPAPVVPLDIRSANLKRLATVQYLGDQHDSNIYIIFRRLRATKVSSVNSSDSSQDPHLALAVSRLTSISVYDGSCVALGVTPAMVLGGIQNSRHKCSKMKSEVSSESDWETTQFVTTHFDYNSQARPSHLASDLAPCRSIDNHNKILGIAGR